MSASGRGNRKKKHMEIEEVIRNKKRFLDLLLLGDEQEEMIDRYLDRGRMFIGKADGAAVAVCVVTEEENGIVEVKNLAVRAECQRRGHGRAMLRHVEQTYPGKTIRLGTGESPATLKFYEKCGYVYSHRIPDFFTDHYDHPIIEEGVLLKDMVYLEKVSN